MAYAPFVEKFPKVAEKETRSIIVSSDPELPMGKYILGELYCDEPGCDCRRVFFDVVLDRIQKSVAVIAWGWEDREFYTDWYGENDRQAIDRLKGPTLNLASPQSKLAPRLLEMIKQVLEDENYVGRIKRHYRLFKEKIERNE